MSVSGHDSRAGSQQSRLAPDRAGAVRHWRNGLLACLGFVLLGAGGVTFQRVRFQAALPRMTCERNLRLLYLAARRLPMRERGASQELQGVVGVLRHDFLITEAESRYLNPTSREHHMAYVGPRLEALLCINDPEFPRKVPGALAGTLDFAPSYVWRRDSQTIAYCPYHRLVLRPDGRVQRL